MLRLALAGALALVFVNPALAADAVSIPYGDWIAALANTLIMVLTAAVAWAFRQLPANIVAILVTIRAEQVVSKAIEYGINAVAGAVKGKSLDVPIANQVIREALDYVVKQAPGWLVSWVGGEDGLRRMIVARLAIAEDAGVK